jgi:hypothetical protein
MPTTATALQAAYQRKAHTPERLALLDELCTELPQDKAELAELAQRANVSLSTLYRWRAGITLYGRLDTVDRVGRALGWRLEWNRYALRTPR